MTQIPTKMKNLTPARERLKQSFRLPSGGYACRSAFPDGCVVVYPWEPELDSWVVDQRWGTDAKFYQALLPKICELGGCPVERFVFGDVVSVALFSRAIANDGKFQYVAECPSCKFQHHDTMVVPDELRLVGSKDLDYTGYDEILLPICEDTLKIRPLLLGDATWSGPDRSDRLRKFSSQLINAVIPIVEINGYKTDPPTPELFDYWAALDPRDKEFITKMEEDLYPHHDTRVEFECDRDGCGLKFFVPLVFDRDFFRAGLVGISQGAMEAEDRASPVVEKSNA